jgi:NADH dehydrogenase
MILVTGGTGFVGRALVRQLVAAGYPVRTLIRPSPRTPRLPRGVPVEVAVSSLGDVRGLRAALRDVDVIYHLASAEGQGSSANLLTADIQGTQNLAQVAAETGVKHIYYVSHLDADRASAYPVLKAKGIAEEHVRRSGVPYTIFRTALVFGPEDHFTTTLARLIQIAPGVLPLPYGGETLLQPLWVEDLVTCLMWAFESPEALNKTYEIGGSEFFSLRQIAEIVMSITRRERWIVPLPMPVLRPLVVSMEFMWPNLGVSTFWLDYLAFNRTCEVSTLPRNFGLMPARFAYRIEYLRVKPWYVRLGQTAQKGVDYLGSRWTKWRGNKPADDKPE